MSNIHHYFLKCHDKLTWQKPVNHFMCVFVENFDLQKVCDIVDLLHNVIVLLEAMKSNY